MRRVNRNIIWGIAIMSLFALSSCKNKASKLVSMQDLSLVKSFPQEIVPKELACEDFGVMGITSLKILDSLFIVGHSNHWTIITLNENKKIGSCLSTGQGPNEFHRIPPCSAAAFISHNDSIIALIADKSKSRIMQFNISKFIKQGLSDVRVAISSEKINNNLWDVIPCNYESALLSVPHGGLDGFDRELLIRDSLHDIEVTNPMDKIKVDKGMEDINLLSRVTRYNDHADRFVEAMLYLNQINIFSRDGKWGKTICVGNKLDDLSEIENESQFERKNGYNTVTAWDFGFGALFNNQTEMGRQTGVVHPSELQIFSWEGSPIARIHIPFSVRAFDIDFNRNQLYVVSEEDEIRVFDIPDMG